jgi:hypothetical protein
MKVIGKGPTLDALQTALYYAARNTGYTVPRAASFVGKALALAHGTAQGLGPPPGPLPRGVGRRPSRALPRTVRFRWECRQFYAPHSNPRLSRGEPGDLDPHPDE